MSKRFARAAAHVAIDMVTVASTGHDLPAYGAAAALSLTFARAWRKAAHQRRRHAALTAGGEWQAPGDVFGGLQQIMASINGDLVGSGTGQDNNRNFWPPVIQIRQKKLLTGGGGGGVVDIFNGPSVSLRFYNVYF